MTGQCRECGRRNQEVLRVSRQGGGSYRRANRSYASSICVPCAISVMDSADGAVRLHIRSWSVTGVMHALNRTEDPAALASVAAYQARREARR